MKPPHLLLIILTGMFWIGCIPMSPDAWQRRHPMRIEMAEAATPDAQAITGNYYEGDGLGYNIYLTLKADGTYSAEWDGCVGKYGEASGLWKLDQQQIILTPDLENGMMKGYLRKLDTFKFRTRWILVPENQRKAYEERGVTPSTCLQPRPG